MSRFIPHIGPKKDIANLPVHDMQNVAGAPHRPVVHGQTLPSAHASILCLLNQYHVVIWAGCFKCGILAILQYH